MKKKIKLTILTAIAFCVVAAITFLDMRTKAAPPFATFIHCGELEVTGAQMQATAESMVAQGCRDLVFRYLGPNRYGAYSVSVSAFQFGGN